MYLTDGSYTIHKITKAWDEVSTVKWTSHSTDFSSTEEDTYNFSPGSCTWADFDISDAVAKMVSGEEQNNGFVIVTHSPKADNSTSGWDGLWTYWASSDNSDSSIRPKLTITYEKGESVIEDVIKQENAFTVSDRTIYLPNGAENAVIRLSNLRGQQLFQVDHMGSASVVLPRSITSGVYVVEVESSSFTGTKRICIK